MTFQQILPLLQGLFSLVLFLLVARQDWRSPLNRLFLLFLGAMGLWGFTVAGMRLSSDLGQALWWERAALIMIGLTAASFYLFVRRYTGLAPSLGHHLAVAFLLATATIAPTTLLVGDMSTDRYGNAPVWGLLFPVWVLVNYALVIAAIVRLEKARRASTSYEERNRYLYFILGASFCIIGAGSDAVSATGVALYPLAIPANIAFSCLTTIAILKYHLLDIRLTLRKGAVYLLTSSLIAVPLVSLPVIWLWLMQTLDMSRWWLVVPLLVLALVLEPLWRRWQEFLERRFYGERYDHLRALERFSEESRGITGMNELCSLVVRLADGTLQPSSVCLLIASARGDFSTAASTGIAQPMPARLEPSNPLVLRLKHEPIPVWHRELDLFPQLQAMSPEEREAANSLRAELYSPIVAEGQLIGILALGSKRLRQLYTREDLQLLSTLCRQAALNLENVRLLKLERERAVHLEKLEQMKSDFLLAVSHQLKTPLTSIKVSAGILAERSESAPDELHGRLVGEISHGVQDLERQISTILGLARLQSATTELNCQPTDVKKLIEQVSYVIAPQVRAKEQTLELTLADSMPTVMIDQQCFRDILASLLSNAAKFTPKGGRISVRVWPDDASFCVGVSDTGPGIPLEEQAKIFDAYYQVKDETGKSADGTGLGLTIAKALVEVHGGRIWVESRPGDGATFFFSLPMGGEAK